MVLIEYRIPLPLTVEEYKIAQLYMIAKKSRDESNADDSAVEILVNDPYTDGPGGSGQYTRKVYHLGAHLPGWLKGLALKSALTVEEEAWNAYPYTKTKYRCPWLEKLKLEIDTVYITDLELKDNIFGLSEEELKERVVDVIDIVKDQSVELIPDEDPHLFTSSKTGRGPLSDDWIEEGKAFMCAYKLCRLEVKYWGMQTKIERFVQDVAMRKVMVRAHRQAWVWQDEWSGLTIDDVRRIEKETQEALAKRKGGLTPQSSFEMDDTVMDAAEEESRDLSSSDEYFDVQDDFSSTSSANWHSAESGSGEDKAEEETNVETEPSSSKEKWLKRRTSVKIKNLRPNHHASDVIVGKGMEQVLRAKFAYGPVDVLALTGEKVDVFAKVRPSGSSGEAEWALLCTETTNRTGSVKIPMPRNKAFNFGITPVKMIVKGDLSSVEFHVAVLPVGTECVVFSIDGSFTSCVSVTAKDPRLRPAAVDVVRHWQELGYLIIYITGRPGMQQRKVISWLARHNFPWGLVSFAEAVSTYFLAHKAEYLTHLMKNVGLSIRAGYGSRKDIAVYQSVGLKPENIYIVGNIPKKYAFSCNNISDGYVAHLDELAERARNSCCPAMVNPLVTIPSGCFSLRGQSCGRN